ncbi:MAG: prolyl oligopeptidase family serine peptidase [Gemmatimonadaceae bacterium]|nr:prolyl oligopeptidase family serine peptidase [Gemmatimonadaceae bacterium]
MRLVVRLARLLSAACIIGLVVALPASGVTELPARAALGATVAPADSLGIRDLLGINTANIVDLSADGRWLAISVSQRRDLLGADGSRDNDPTYLRLAPVRLVAVDTRSLAQRDVFKVKKTVRTATWSPDATKLAMLVVENDAVQVVVWDRANGATTTAKLPAGQYVAENSELRWSEDGKTLAFAARAEAWKAKAKARFAELTKGPVTVLDGTEDFLEWDAMNRMNAERSIVQWTLATGAVTTLRATGRIGPWTLAKDGSAITVQEDITKKTDYDVIGGREWKLVTQAVGDTASRTLIASLKGVTLSWATDGRRYATTREGRVFVGSIADTSSRQILGPVTASRGAAAAGAPATPDTSAAARAQRAKERFSVVRWSPAGDALLAQNSEGFWLTDVATGTKEMIVALPDSNSTAPRPQLNEWSDDGRYLYFAEYARTKWDRAVIRYDRQTRQRAELARGARFFNGLRLSKDGSTAVLAIGDGNRIADVFVADPQLGSLRRVIETNPQLAQKPIARTELIKYSDADGKSRYGVVFLPADYQQGTRYPTVFLIYETFFDNTWDVMANLLTAHGYAVVKPSVGFETGYPGEAWQKGVLAAANEVIRMGIADSSRLGVHGTSYGGYATNLLITYTDRFKAAINMSGKVDIISFYTDSPRLGVRNIHAAEKSQDRIGATLWQQPQKYVEHSAIMFADRIKTPLLLMTGGEDHNVPAINTREMYYALRRLGRTVVWANYVHGGHGTPNTTEADFIDYHQRVLDWYGKYLKPVATSP